MSLDMIEQYEAEAAARRALVRRILVWVPLALALVFALVGGLSLLGASSGHEEDYAIQEQLLVEMRAEAQQAEQDSLDAYAELVEAVSRVDADRVTTDTATMRTALAGVFYEPSASDDDALVALLEQGAPSIEGPMQLDSLEVVLLGTRGPVHDYIATMSASSTMVSAGQGPERPTTAHAVLTWSAGEDGIPRETQARWSEDSEAS